MLKEKNILLIISGGIAAYKAAELARLLVKRGASIQVIMTKNACEFITPLTFDTLTGHRTITDLFDRNHPVTTEHIALADWADILIAAPASANLIAKFSWGLADDMASTTALAFNKKKIVAPAMNDKMWANPATQENIARLKKYGWEIIGPGSGDLACGTAGKGRMSEPEDIVSGILGVLSKKDLLNKKILVSAGPTREALDPVRFLSNHSTGKQGYAVAKAAAMRGAKVTLVSGPTELADPMNMRVIHVNTAREMFASIRAISESQDVIIMSAAVADYRPKEVSIDKIKKKDADLSLALERTDDILEYLGEHKPAGQILVGFSMETADLIYNSRKKLEAKKLDLIAANNVKVEGAGFGGETNVLTLISRKEEVHLPLLSKEEAANRLLDNILKL
ncbi:MAG: bifunctional phosphopantothenoylcysteine decarboxylase/phosphopantothenate--cysteine ligase CoaBC [Lachnospiraceae bacterium]|nr:bifunctional phosphopantothenoylcysteine decarboxylase/phosphopantothenate--cysteine ligase CoaBC [Lachnospiraceae bacterium]